jgi:hypothetical protein
VPSQTKATLEKFNRFMNTKNNFQNYRHTLHRVKDPCVPYIGTDLNIKFFCDQDLAVLKSRSINCII